MSDPRVLVVEDEVIVANQIQRKLEKIGFRVVGKARSGERAIEMAAAEMPDLILMDIKIEGEMDGVETTQKLRRNLDIPIIYLTAHADEETLGRAKITEPLGYIVKPFDEIDLKSTIEIALYRHEINKKLKKSRERYKNLFEGIPIPLFRISSDGSFLNANQALVNCLKLPDKGFLSNIQIPDIFLKPADLKRYEHLMNKNGEVHDFETQFRRHDGSTIWVNINSRMVVDEEEDTVSHEGSLEDITQRKLSEDEMRKKLMRYNLVEGNVYLVKEITPTLSLEAVRDLLDVGYQGTIISRTVEREWKKMLDKEFTCLWLAERGGEKTIRPKFDKMSGFVGSLSRNDVLLIDRFDYLIFKNDFRKSLDFIQDLRELASLGKFIAIISLDPLTVKKQEMRLIEKECRNIDPRHRSILSDDLLGVLRFIFKQNTIGIKPSYSVIAKEVHISRPTVRKRLALLNSAGYVIERIRGNSKVLELSERGREIFWK